MHEGCWALRVRFQIWNLPDRIDRWDQSRRTRLRDRRLAPRNPVALLETLAS